jgi:hypothetical protein
MSFVSAPERWGSALGLKRAVYRADVRPAFLDCSRSPSREKLHSSACGEPRGIEWSCHVRSIRSLALRATSGADSPYAAAGDVTVAASVRPLAAPIGSRFKSGGRFVVPLSVEMR